MPVALPGLEPPDFCRLECRFAESTGLSEQELDDFYVPIIGVHLRELNEGAYVSATSVKWRREWFA